jgi:hypothetical protein
MLNTLTAGSAHVAPAEPHCRLCGARLHRSLLDLGDLPLATRTLAAGKKDRLYPLHVRLCDDCGLAQVAHVVSSPAIIPTALSPATASRIGRYAEGLRDRFRPAADSLVIEIGKTDSPLLPVFGQAGVPTLGIPADAADFNTETAMEIAVRHGCADIVVAHDILPHAADLFGFAAGLACILRPNGVLSLQFPHLPALIQRAQFDAFQHDIPAYLSLPVTERLLRSVGLRAFDAERVPDDGGSLRLHVCHSHSPRPKRPGLKTVRMAEAEMINGQPAFYTGFSDRVAVVRDDIRAFLRNRQEAKRRVAGYGAGPRGVTMLAWCGMTAREVARVADSEPAVHGRVLPGSHIPIVSVEALMQAPPDDLIILAWPSAAEITLRLQPLRRTGTQFWTMLPRIGRV